VKKIRQDGTILLARSFQFPPSRHEGTRESPQPTAGGSLVWPWTWEAKYRVGMPLRTPSVGWHAFLRVICSLERLQRGRQGGLLLRGEADEFEAALVASPPISL